MNYHKINYRSSIKHFPAAERLGTFHLYKIYQAVVKHRPEVN